MKINGIKSYKVPTGRDLIHWILFLFYFLQTIVYENIPLKTLFKYNLKINYDNAIITSCEKNTQALVSISIDGRLDHILLCDEMAQMGHLITTIQMFIYINLHC